MKISNVALKKIDNQRGRLTLCLALECSETWMRKVIKANKDNGPLTKTIALIEIEKLTGLSKDEILTTNQSNKKPLKSH